MGAYGAAARAYVVYGLVYLAGGLYLLHHGVGVMGAPTTGATTRAMVTWGAIGLIPLVVFPWLLTRRWSWLGGWVSRRAFAFVLAALLFVRAFKVGQVAIRGGASVAAPWGGAITFQAGAAIFLVVTLLALGFVLRAALRPDGGAR